MKKVLLIAAGRRVSLAQRFIAHGFDVYSYETEVECPISSIATVIEGKRLAEPDVRESILETINYIEPDLVLPLSDHATPILSSIPYKGVVTASGRTNTICLNKKKFEETLLDRDYYPGLTDNREVIAKPIFGANSKGIEKINFQDYSKREEVLSQTHIFQRCVQGFEISVDAYFNKFSKMIDAVPRKRVEVQGGEVSRSTTLPRDSFDVVKITKEVGEQIGLVGPVCAQYIIDHYSNKPYIMEINSRFGGGVILSLEAGFDQIQLLSDEWIDGKPCLPQLYDWKPNFSMTRYFQEYFYGGNDE
jgi:predicted ATP-grasp superfamily ATP-dependent carboligase